MEKFKIALVQQHSEVRNKQMILENTIGWAKKAKQNGAELICFPELSFTGHIGDVSMVDAAEEVPGGRCASEMIRLAKELDMYICAGIAELDAGLYYNTQFLAGPEGFVGKQRKIHLSRKEYFYFRAGTNISVFSTRLARIGMIICFDNNFPETSRCLAVKGAELLLCPHACLTRWTPVDKQDREDAVLFNRGLWKKLHPARADDNGCYVALCNAVGPAAPHLKDVNSFHAGNCMVFDPYGELAAESESKDIVEEMLIVELDGDLVTKRRLGECFQLKTRRPEIYKALIEPTE